MMAVGFGIAPLAAHADFVITARNSELVLASTNLGGVAADLNSNDTSTPFFALLNDSTTHEEPGGNVNGGIWYGMQDSSVAPSLIRAKMHTEVITQQLAGDGIPILDLRNEFEVEFQVTETTEIELGGSMFGTPDIIGADDFVRVQLQEHNGVVFINMFSTSALDDLNSPFLATLEPNTTYRLHIESHADSMGADANVSGATICLRPQVTAGDVNLDGEVNLLDVDPFVDAITLGTYLAEADTNCDGILDLTDVDSFIAILHSGG